MSGGPENTSRGNTTHQKEEKDANDKALFVEFVNVAAQGEGWVDYVWPKPGEDKPSPKETYIYQVPGTQYFVGTGIYP